MAFKETVCQEDFLQLAALLNLILSEINICLLFLLRVSAKWDSIKGVCQWLSNVSRVLHPYTLYDGFLSRRLVANLRIYIQLLDIVENDQNEKNKSSSGLHENSLHIFLWCATAPWPRPVSRVNVKWLENWPRHLFGCQASFRRSDSK